MFLIPTVQHSGTILITQKFKGYHYASVHEEPQKNTIFVGHISPGLISYIGKLIRLMPAIIPIRHPFLVEESWKRRGKGSPINNFKLLLDLDHFKPFYIPVDSPERDDYLDVINKKFNISLEKTWPITNSIHHTYHFKDLNPSEEIRHLSEEPFFKQFY